MVGLGGSSSSIAAGTADSGDNRTSAADSDTASSAQAAPSTVAAGGGASGQTQHDTLGEDTTGQGPNDATVPDNVVGKTNTGPEAEEHTFSTKAGDVAPNNASAAADSSMPMKDKAAGLAAGAYDQLTGNSTQAANTGGENEPIVGPGIHDPQQASQEVKKLETSQGEQPLAATRAADPTAAVGSSPDPEQPGASHGLVANAVASTTAAATVAATAAKEAMFGAGSSEAKPNFVNDSAEISKDAGSHGISSAGGKGTAGMSSSPSGRATLPPAEAEKVRLSDMQTSKNHGFSYGVLQIGTRRDALVN